MRIDDFAVWAESERADLPLRAAGELAPLLGPLLGFYWVYRAGGYAKAARVFPYPITQPGLHRQIGVLERSLKLRLFEKGDGRNIVPTRAGRQLYGQLVPFLGGVHRVTGLRESLEGELRVQASRLVIDTVLPAWIRRSTQANPGLVITLEQLGAPDPSLLHDDVADVLIAHYGGQRTVGLARTLICTLDPYLVFNDARPRHAAKPTRRIMDRLADQAFVAYRPDLEAHALQKAALERLRLRPRIVALVDSASSCLSMVAGGVGYSIVPALRASDITERRLSSVSLGSITGGRSFPVEAITTTRTSNPLISAFLACATR